MTVELAPELESFIAAAMASGRFSSKEAVIARALELLKEEEDWKTEAQSKIEEGWACYEAGDMIDRDVAIQSLHE